MRTLLAVCATLIATLAHADEPVSFDQLTTRFDSQIHPLLKQFCLECHSTKTKEGELDLERFKSLAIVRKDAKAWQKVAEMLDNGEMPPADSPQLSVAQRTLLRTWVGNYLDTEARASAGDPGPVVLRRLNNTEFTYTIQDLTGTKLEPAREFPADSGAGEGFTNSGESLVMSPALVQKYLDAAQSVAGHAVLLPDGFRFSNGATRSDWTNEILGQIRGLYAQHTKSAELKGVRVLDNSEIENARKAMLEDGRVDLTAYLAALIKNRKRVTADPDAAIEIARDEFLSEKYLRLLARMLVKGEVELDNEVPIVIDADADADADAKKGDAPQPIQKPSSIFLNAIRETWRTATPQDAAALAARIRDWQDQTWKFEPVGHLGLIRLWESPVNPIVRSGDFRVKLIKQPDKDVVRVYLATGTAGDSDEHDFVVWQNPRIERPGKPPILLRDVQFVSAGLRLAQESMAQEFTQYLVAARDVRDNAQADVDKVAAAHKINPAVLRPFVEYLNFGSVGETRIQRLELPLRNANYSFVNGWGLTDVGDLSVNGNSSDQDVKIPGDMNAHKIVVHPRPERWVAAGWKSPIAGLVTLTPSVRDAHPACGDGVEWRLELARGVRREVLAQGVIDAGKQAATKPLEKVQVKAGDLVSVVISRRGNYYCDLTEIDLSIVQTDGDKSTWLLSKECADHIAKGNPLPDVHGNPSVWHFHWGMMDDSAVPALAKVPLDSMLAKWIDATDDATRKMQATELQQFVNSPLPKDATPANAELHRHLTDIDGALFSKVVPADLAQTIKPEQLKVQDAKYGISPALFGKHPSGRTVPASDLIVQAPFVVEFDLPAHLIVDAEFVVSGTLVDPKNETGLVQLTASTTSPNDPNRIMPRTPFVVQAGTQAEQQLIQSLNEFRAMFPAAMCHARIVPIDEVVTLLLFHREDHHLVRLMLSDEERVELDRLWSELRYVSEEALRTLASLEQILEFSTQDADPRKFDPVLKPIADNAAEYRQLLLGTERIHLEKLVEFAEQTFRRPLQKLEADRIRSLYASLRKQEIAHEPAFRLTLARVLSSPSFLYRLENREQSPGTKPARPSGVPAIAISDWELANRLSYFLWSTMPDETLRGEAKAGRLHTTETLTSQLKRMTTDDRVRRLAIEFGCQWLHIRDFDAFDEKSERHFPEFASLRGDMYEESIRFFTDFVQRDGSILSLIDADHTFVNDRLAKLYGIPDVTGAEWRRVDNVRRFARGGILAQATTLSRQSGASRTSPILRGNWVSESLLGERLPRPPKNVPELPNDESQLDGLTIRQLVEKHSTDPACAKCHKRIDPFGFALETFDPIGRSREVDLGNRPIDTATTLLDGTKIMGLDGLRDYLVKKRRDDFVRQFCRKLMGYALGRATQLSDEPLLDEVTDRLAKNDFRISVAIEAIVLSNQFRMIRTGDVVDVP